MTILVELDYESGASNGWMFGEWPWTALEDISLKQREDLERRYQKNPTRMHALLVHTGKWMIAAQLKIDYQVGRLAG